MPTFKYCLNASTIRPTPLLEKISVAGRAGYSAIELWHDEIDAYLDSGGSLNDIRKALADQRLEVPTTIYLANWFDAQGSAFRQAWDECRRRLEQAAEIGAIYVIASPPAGKANYVEGGKRYHELLELGLSLGVRPAMEFLGFVEDLNTIEKAMEVMERSEAPEATTVLDPFHIFRGGGSMESIAKLQGSQIAISHFNDTPSHPARVEQHDKDRVMPGEGHLDLKRYVQLLAATGYDQWLSLELFNEALWQRDPLEVAREGLTKMRAICEQ